jgi:predicted  nucleic acid-binding Zn-ribbon protein
MEVATSTVLKALIRLQEIEFEIRDISGKVEAAPDEIEKLKSQMELERHIVETVEASIKRSNSQRVLLEKEVEENKLKLSNYKTRLMEVRTNNEYQAMLHEIDYVEKRIAEKEDEILEVMLQVDQLNDQLGQAKKEYSQIEQNLKKQQSEVQSFVEESEFQLSDLRREYEDLQSEIPIEFLDRYRRIAAARNGKALAPVIDNCCEGCHVRLRPQLYAEIVAGRQIILCENCNRILYNPA